MTFAAELGRREKILTAFVGATILLLLAIFYGASGGNVRDAHFTVPVGILVVTVVAALGFRPLAFTLGPRDLVVERPFGDWRLPYAEIRAVRANASYPTLFTVGILRAEGFFGSYGLYWNRPWGLFRVFVTDSRRLVEIVREDGSRVVVSPNDPHGFRDALMAKARESGAEIAFAT
jgi:hypothetical protein